MMKQLSMVVITILTSLTITTVQATPPDVIRSAQFKCHANLFQRAAPGMPGWKSMFEATRSIKIDNEAAAKCSGQTDRKAIKAERRAINNNLWQEIAGNPCVADAALAQLKESMESCRSDLLRQMSENIALRKIGVNDVSLEAGNNVTYTTHDDITGKSIPLGDVPELKQLTTQRTKRGKTHFLVHFSSQITLEDLKAKK